MNDGTKYLIPEGLIREQATNDGVTHFVTGIAVMKDNALLVVRRIPEDFLGGIYELPGGGVDNGETFAEGAARELLEETGLVVSGIVTMFIGFDYATKTKPKVRQLNFLVTVEPGEVQLEPTEHDNYKWIVEADTAALATSEEMKQCLRGAFSSAKASS